MAAAAVDSDRGQIVPRLKDDVAVFPADIDEKSVSTIRKWQEQARVTILQSVQLFVEPKDESDLVSLLRTAHSNLAIDAPIIEGLSRTYDIAIYDVKCCGESVTHPHIRIMSFRSEHCQVGQGVRAEFAARGQQHHEQRELSSCGFGDGARRWETSRREKPHTFIRKQNGITCP